MQRASGALQSKAGLRTRRQSSPDRLTPLLYRQRSSLAPSGISVELRGKRLVFCQTAQLKSPTELLAYNRPTDLFSSRRQHKDAQIYHSKYHHYLACRNLLVSQLAKQNYKLIAIYFPLCPGSIIRFPLCCNFILILSIWGLENWQM